MLPNALIIGPMRTGTSWAYEYLKSRDDINLPRGVKETFYFDRHFKKGKEWYTSHFKNSRTNLALEVGPSYFHSEKAPHRIRETLGDIPIIINKRDPVDRSYSHFKHLVRYGKVQNNVRAAIEEYPEIIVGSQYEYQLDRWEKYFDKRNIHVLNFDLITKNPRRYLKSLCHSLGLEFLETEFQIERKVNEGQLVKFPLINGLITSTGNALRSLKLYSVVNFAKNIGIKKMFLGGNSLDEDSDSFEVKKIIKEELLRSNLSQM